MANLVVTLTEAVTLNGSTRGSTNTLTIAGIDDVYHRIVTCPASVDTTIATFEAAANTADGGLSLEQSKYIRVTNMDSTHPINLSLQVSNDEDGAADFSSTILVEAGKSFLMGTPHDGIQVSDANATIITALVDLESILVDPGNQAIQVEVFVAGVIE
mgnify:CR=1 FL=1|jgi:hypothetical protein|tara:strand:- start:323 stop:796 length:474 start_codon:yes stop_codon:yes gene_type:complete